ncbi:MAG: STAS domain-containing protein [Polyangiales bacterium]
MAATFEERLRRAEAVLTRVADGDLDQRLDVGEGDDALSGLEIGINFLIVDLRSTAKANEEQRNALMTQQRELEAKLLTIEQQAAAIRELTTPVMEIWDDVLVLPIVGVVDTRRSMDIMNNVLEKIVERQSKCVIIDVTGVEMVDTKTADYLLKVFRAANLLGTRCVLTGLSPAVAQTLVEIGADLTEIRTLRNLKAGLLDCLRFLKGQAA